MRVTQAMLLAAGLSTRLRPLTNDIPKPMLPFLGQTLLYWNLAYLKKNGIRSVAVNVHHGRERFLRLLSEAQILPVTPFVETPIILGTGGGIRNMKSFVTGETFAVVNCDFLTDIDLAEVYKFHKAKKAIATMVLIPHAGAKKYGSVGVDSSGKIVAFPYGKNERPSKKRGLFSGIHIFDRKIFDEMPLERVFCINREVYAPLVEKGAPVYGFLRKARWYDIGEIELYEKAQRDLLRKPFPWMKSLLS